MPLIVHEDAAARARLADDLHEEGFATDGAGDGLEAIRKVWQGRYDIVLADAHLSEMDTRTLVAHLGNIAPEVQVVVIDE